MLLHGQFWNAEDWSRGCERAEFKRDINLALGSGLMEEKLYAS